MQEYNSPEEYIKDVQRYIRWSRAKVVATRELSDHINDQYDALRENGLNQKEAMRKAIEEMGDADVVGTELDIRYSSFDIRQLRHLYEAVSCHNPTFL